MICDSHGLSDCNFCTIADLRAKLAEVEAERDELLGALTSEKAAHAESLEWAGEQNDELRRRASYLVSRIQRWKMEIAQPDMGGGFDLRDEVKMIRLHAVPDDWQPEGGG